MKAEEIIIDANLQKPVIIMIRLGTGDLINIIKLRRNLTLTEFQELRTHIIHKYGVIIDESF